MIYVDNLGGCKWGLKMYQMVPAPGTDICELHAFAIRIGLVSVQFDDTYIYPHYDITRKERERAIKEGAVPVLINNKNDVRLFDDLRRHWKGWKEKGYR